MIELDNTYRTEKLLDWERKSLTGKYSDFSLTKKSTWMTLGLMIFVGFALGFLIPFIPPRYSWGGWTPATTSEEYWYRVTNFWTITPILILSVFAFVNLRNKLDLAFGAKRTANFKVTEVLNLWTIKVLLMNGWRPFSIRAKQPYFNSVAQGQIITIKRTYTYSLIDYYIREIDKFHDEQNKEH